ncbi:hypothetical protein FOCG_13037 [Fusarium oxysporum f. sp. radicis-lycopersici 26381]|nr:hypothetical protein FOCG_13037 [Fusarium oxysporum f. sp. radicis-lycopersici 26381]
MTTELPTYSKQTYLPMTESSRGHLLTDNQSLQKLGLDSSQPATWEDDLRSPDVESGEWEWWYADAHLQDGWFSRWPSST